MDPSPRKFPILAYVMEKLPSIGHRLAAEFDIEQPPQSPTGASPSKEPHFELTERMPQLTDPNLVAAMRSAVGEVAQTRSVIRALGERPDHETVDHAKAKLKEIEENLSTQLDEIALSPRSWDADRREGSSQVEEKEDESQKAVENKRHIYKTIISLDQMHESYGNLLREAEQRLEKIYEKAVAGGDKAATEVTGESETVTEKHNEEVIAILQEASVKNVERISLSGRHLRILPEAFGKLSGLAVLDLSSNQLEVIPDSIAGLERLEELNLSSNALESLPDSIGLLLNLKILNACGNKLSTLPDSICNCRSLVELDMSFNKLAYLPTNIGHELVNLKKLLIHLNKICSLPTSIGEMKSLLVLDVHFNELRGLPLTIGKLKNLEVLNLSSNFSDLSELPDMIAELNNLKELDLSNNQIHELPITFGQLENLTKLNLDHNPLVIPPKEVANQGVQAVRVFMTKRWLDTLAQEEERSLIDSKEQSETGLLSRSTSWLNNTVAQLSRAASGHWGSPRSGETYLDQQL